MEEGPSRNQTPGAGKTGRFTAARFTGYNLIRDPMSANLQLREVPKEVSMTLPSTLYAQVSEKAAQMNVGVDEAIAVLLRYGLAVQEQREAELECLAGDLRSPTISNNPGEKKRLGDELGGAIFGR
jgi:hypothetical protein